MSALARSRTAAASLSALAAVGGTAALMAPAHATPGGPKAVERVAGVDRYGTAELASKSLWPAWNDTGGTAKADAVVIAKGDDFPDALSGIPLASAKRGPLLVTPGTGLDPGVLAEITRVLQPGAGKTVYVLGGVKALRPTVDAALTAAGYNVRRIAGSDRYDTSVQVAHALGDPQRVVVATGNLFPDALAAGPLASMGGIGKPGAILLSNDTKLSPAVAAYIAPIIGGFPTNGTDLNTGQSVPFDNNHFVIAVGGKALTAVSTAAASLPERFNNFETHTNYFNAAGTDRYQTACFAADLWSNIDGATSHTALDPSAVGVATAFNFPDALGGGAAIAQVPGPLLLTDPNGLAPCASDYIRAAAAAHTLNWVEIYGGTSVLPVGIENQLHQIAGF